MRFEWNEDKNRQNLKKHDVRFEAAILVFDDPYALTQPDPSSNEEERWITLGMIGSGTLLLAVHTYFAADAQEVFRVISARAATRHEKKTYEEAHKGTKARHRRNRGEKR